MNKINALLNPQVVVSKCTLDVTEEYESNEQVPWVQDLLTELEEDNDKEAIFPKAGMVIQNQIIRKTNSLFGSYLIVHSQLKAHFHQPCGRCLFPLPQELDLNFAATFLHESQEKLPEYADLTSIYSDGEEMELYFFHKGIADILELTHEQIYLEVPPFPRCVEECKNPVFF